MSNPLPAVGGVDPEDIEAARRDAPQAFRTQERAVTAADYAAAADRRPDVQRAAATFRWTGSWHTVFVTADRFGGAEVDAASKTACARHLERFRMAGYDLEVDAPRFVPLDVALHVCVKPGYFRARCSPRCARCCRACMLARRPARRLPPRQLHLRPAGVSPAASSRPRRRSKAWSRCAWTASSDWSIRILRRRRTASIPIGRLEIAQLANDPNFRDRGRLLVSAGGGQ